MNRLTSYVILDILKNKIILFYTAILTVFAWSVLNMEDTSLKSVLSLLNIMLLITPLVSLVFSTIYLYNSSEFIELLVSQPIKRKSIWLALFFGLAFSLNFAFLLSIGLPALWYIQSGAGLILVISGMILSTIFVSLGMLCAITMKDKARGIGLSILIWLLMTLIYDSLVLFFMFQFSDYPIEKPMVIFSAINPIDLSRIMVILQIDVAALMGYSGAIFKKLFGTDTGLLISLFIMIFWIVGPLYLSLKMFLKKDL